MDYVFSHVYILVENFAREHYNMIALTRHPQLSQLQRWWTSCFDNFVFVQNMFLLVIVNSASSDECVYGSLLAIFLDVFGV